MAGWVVSDCVCRGPPSPSAWPAVEGQLYLLRAVRAVADKHLDLATDRRGLGGEGRHRNLLVERGRGRSAGHHASSITRDTDLGAVPCHRVFAHEQPDQPTFGASLANPREGFATHELALLELD